MTGVSIPLARAVRFRFLWTITFMMLLPERRTMDYDRLTLPEIPVQKERPIWYIHPVLRDMGLDERSSSDRLHNAGYQIVQIIRLQTKNIDLLSSVQTYSILLSTIRQQRPGCQYYWNQRFHNSIDLQPMTTRPCRHSPFLSRTGNVLHAFLLQSFWILTFIQENIPLYSCNPWGLHGPENPFRILADSKQRLRPFPFLSRKELRLATFS